MRFAPDGTAVAYTAGYGGGPLSLPIVDASSGQVLAVLPGGHDPRWLDTHTIVARSLDGTPGEATVNGYRCKYVGANDGDLDACRGREAVAADRSAGVTVYSTNASPRTFAGTFEPALSPGGTIVLRDLASGSLRMERLAGCVDPPASVADLGAGTRPRWSSATLAWDTVPFGRVLARSTPDQPTIDLSVADHSCVMPVPLWTGALLLLGFVLDDGTLVVAPWDKLMAHDDLGWVLGASGGSAFDWDLAVVPQAASLVRVAYLAPSGDLVLVTVDTTTPLGSLFTSPPITPPITPIDPPVTPIDPEPPEPIDPPVTPIDPVEPDAMQIVTYDEWRNMEGRLEDTYCNHGGHPPRQVTTHVNAEGEVWRKHYADRRNPGDMPHEQAIRSIESEIDVIEGRPDRWASTTPAPGVPGVAGPLQGPIGTDRRWFTVPG